MLPLDTFLSIIASASTAAGPLLGLFIYAMFRGWIVLGSTHRKAVAEGEEWKRMTLRLTGVAEISLKQARRKLPARLQTDGEEGSDESGA